MNLLAKLVITGLGVEVLMLLVFLTPAPQKQSARPVVETEEIA